ncbi:biotin--[acetyl-CoA-carboxylase] ligase [Wielerella bovis]|uniref:biotin--[acetyl-CoA-carboxylase] ligase n=1 Tax=Wielerella bovis TaxID=2917790 RepID=UPI00201971E3|nr:biotin--[acetyl-CoA-carboxylase] ligase [Wielerella bovis]ULJ69718.1 biotin--[acetyl-CoA-carboxylase] ligase [Wielerella bovis]
MLVNKLLVALADGMPHHITELAQQLMCQPQQLNSLWQQVPPTLRPLLRQRDGFWQLTRPIALLSDQYTHTDFTVEVLSETTSTNTVLLDKARSGCPIHRHVVLSHQQTQGRGRQGRKWQHDLGECLMFSIGWTFSQTQAQLGTLAPIVALACQRALSALNCHVQIKWPNDLVIGLDKLGGILIETVRKNEQTHAIIGIGINFMQPEKIDNATSFQAACTQKNTPASLLLDKLLQEIHTLLIQFEQTGFAPFQTAYEAVHRDQKQYIYLLHDEQIIHYGRILGISETGALRLQTEQGEQEIINGEVSLRRPEQLSGSLKLLPRYLLLDAGNSRLKWAWVENGEIVHTTHAPYRDLSRLQQDWAEWGRPDVRIIGSAVCGIAKQDLVQSYLPHPIEWLTSMYHALGVTNHYRNPREHGTDRWFSALGSRRFTQNACVIVSCGTAVTIDALTADNHYLGGSIMPGFHLMRESLLHRTANLNRPEGQFYPFPTTTANAIATGMLDAVCGSIILMHTRLKERNHQQTVDIILTGGGAAKILGALPPTFVLDNCVKIVDNLVIFGLINWIEQK